MNDGGRESGRDEDGDGDGGEKKSGVSGGDDFGRAVSRTAVVQICESSGFDSCQQSALDALTDVAIRYICGIGKGAKFYAGLSGRTECNVFDIVQGLEDLEVSQGYTGASDVNHCLAGSGAVREITRYVDKAEEIPFARSIPHFPVERTRKQIPSFAQLGETPSGKHIPVWLPAFPDPHTYISTPVLKNLNQRESDPQAVRVEQVRQQRKAENSLLNLQRRVSADRHLPAHGSNDVREGKRTVSVNPFLSQPLPFGEREVSEIVIPKDDYTKGEKSSVLEVFAPAIEAAKVASLDCENSDKMPLPNKRPSVRFKFRVKEKPIATLVPSNTIPESCFLRDDGKDAKKRRAEMILKEAMENPEDLMQL